MNIPNLLSLFRLFVTFFFILLIAYGHFRLALLLFVIQAFSDLLDGFLARRMHAKTALGAYLDPLADKVMLASSYVALALMEVVPVWLAAIVLLRDLVISIGFLILLKRGLRTNPIPIFISKTTTVFQMLTIVYMLWSVDLNIEWIFFYATGLLTVVSGIQYILIGCSVFFRKEMV
jgi:cardiolipin synthase